jgi:diguanylate cyclase (GGDEF)-like protein
MRVLIAEDEAVPRRLLQASLERWGYEVVVASNGSDAAQILLSPDAPKMALLDWLMPGVDGAELCQTIRRNKPEPYTYILLLTGRRTQDDVIRGLEAGADDYVRKPFDPAELKVRLRTGKRILYLQDRLISSREALRDQATRDGLTGLWNRAAIVDIVGDELARSAREGGSLGVLLADLDRFKGINDAYGHLAGDEVLKAVARAMRSSVRRYDAVGRYGGEEFLIVLPGCDGANAVSHAERLRAAVGRVAVKTPLATIHPSISLGVVVSDRHTSLDIGDLIQAADMALYRAKDGGRNRVEAAAAMPVFSEKFAHGDLR